MPVPTNLVLFLFAPGMIQYSTQKSIVFVFIFVAELPCGVSTFLLNLNIYYLKTCCLLLFLLILLSFNSCFCLPVMHTELSLTCPSQCVTTSGDTFTLHITETGQIPPPVLCVTSREQMERKQVVCDSTASLPLEYSLLLNLTGKHDLPFF